MLMQKLVQISVAAVVLENLTAFDGVDDVLELLGDSLISQQELSADAIEKSARI